MKRIPLLHSFAVLGALVLTAPAATAGPRCSDDPERCVKSTATLARPVARLVVGSASAPELAAAPTPGAPSQVARRATAPARKVVGKPQRTAQRVTPAPTPGMGMLLKLSTGGGGDVPWLQGRSSEASPGQSWVL